MKWFNKKNESEEVSYWQTISDVMSALLLMLLLVILLLILYVIRVPENENIDMYHEVDVWHPDNGWDEDAGDDNHDWDASDWWHDVEVDSSGGSGGGHDEPEHQFDEFGYEEFEGIDKAAVYVLVVDGDSQKQIHEPDVTFNLRNMAGEEQVLNTYYPRRIAYKEFKTTDQGEFYLPEKVRLGEYLLHELTEPYGYDATADLAFLIEDPHDWDEPYILYVPLYPARNVVRIQAKDTLSGEPVGGGLYDVVAAHDVITADGTLRYTAGQVVDQIVCNDAGEGESVEIYLGDYIIRQNTPPEYYAGMAEPVNVTVSKKTPGVPPAAHALALERTMYTLTVLDEYYQDRPVPGAEFRLFKAGSSVAVPVVTDAQGCIVLNELEKNSTYTLRQVTAPEGYQARAEDVVFTVAGDGRIDLQARAEGETYDRMVRMTIAVKDALLHIDLPDFNVAVKDAQGQLIKNWNTIGVTQIQEGFAPGQYHITVSGNGKTEMDVTLLDTAQVQTFECLVWTTRGYAAIIGAGVAGVGMIALAIVLLRKKRHS